MLIAMCFPAKLVFVIHMCISIVTYEILINGYPRKSFTLESGLRQGDPLSSYLFILGASILSRLIKSKVSREGIHGIQVAKSAPLISHLLFADDSFCLRTLTSRRQWSL